ncbi:TMEM43 family protein [Azospirillum sp. SYSU D00513]|uniref:TMEM43 family protein n=1 Tax=Azospirillum sp. SYSU D00513 TaxID=2812561 RepID=UPI001A95ACE2|nr:TMEM43 family protein [Azospirillum sp. SYSU D00513]
MFGNHPHGRIHSMTEVTVRGPFARLGNSLLGALFGVLLFLGSLGLLFWNEGRDFDAMTALNAGAESVVSISPDSVDPANEGRLVHLSGPVAVPGPLQDPVFRVTATEAIRLDRRVEMYQWQEERETRTETTADGEEIEETTYHYFTDWSEQPIDSTAFRWEEGHVNPTTPYRSATLDARGSRVGAFAMEPGLLSQIGDFLPMPPDLAAPVPEGFHWAGERLHSGAPDQPRVGDLRVTFHVVPAQTISVAAAQSGDWLTAFTGERGYPINLVETGVHSADAMFARARTDERNQTWMLRALGFGMMLLGLLMLGSPVLWLGSVSSGSEGAVAGIWLWLALCVSVPLTILTIAVAWLVHRPLAGAGLIAAGVLLALAFRWLLSGRGVGGPAVSGARP